MTAVPALPHLWDGRRLLRFLAGLALVALAFAAQAGLIPGPAAPATADRPATVTAVVDIPTVDVAPAASAADDAAGVPPVNAVLPSAGVGGVPGLKPAGSRPSGDSTVPAGAGLRSYPSRGPPKA